jgi:hypothetical protein
MLPVETTPHRLRKQQSRAHKANSTKKETRKSGLKGGLDQEEINASR